MARALPVLACLVAQRCLGADPSKPHINKGINHPFPTTKQVVSLTAKEESILASGGTVKRQVVADGGKGGRAMAVQDISAKADTVWTRILAFSEYPKMVNGVLACSNYEEVKHRNGTQSIKTHMKLGVLGVKLEYFIHHTYEPKLGVLTWTLDYHRLSDLIDSVGYWCVVRHPSDPSRARVFYSVDASLPSWVPGFVVTAVTSKALTDATAWVKVEAEKAQLQIAPSQIGSPSVPRSKRDCRNAGGVWSKRKCQLPAPPAEAGPTSYATEGLLSQSVVSAMALAVLGVGFAILRERSSRVAWE